MGHGWAEWTEEGIKFGLVAELLHHNCLEQFFVQELEFQVVQFVNLQFLCEFGDNHESGHSRFIN